VIRIGAPIVADEARPRLQEVFKRYAFGPFELDPALLVLARGGEPVPLGPRVVATLLALVERAGDVVTKDELLDQVWSGEDVGESNVAQSVYTLRKVLRDHGLADAIATVPRRGYRFAAPVELLAQAASTPFAVRREPAPAADRGRAAAPQRPRTRWLAAAAALALVFLGGVPETRVVPAARLAPALSARGAEQYRLGRYYWNLRTPAGLAASRRLFAAVVASDPRSPLGYAGLADADLMTVDYEHAHVKPAVYIARARAEIRTALALDPHSAAAHTSLAMLRFSADHAAAAAEAELRRAIALDPGYAVAHHWYGTILLDGGRLAEATRELKAAAALDPVSAATGGWLAEASYYRGRFGDAIVYARRALDLDPQRRGALRRLGLSYELAGDLPRAIAAFERMRRGGGDEAADAPALLAEAYARAGRRDLARAALRIAVHLHPRDGDTALAMLALGQREQGLAILAAMQPAKADYPGVRDPRLEPFVAALRTRAARRKPFG
jgi:DNA-binding winged helix-turn-helix (wHTH) protein/Tfp pilus assembly protein PilF